MLIWANSHGSFLLGLLLLSIWAASDVVSALTARMPGGKRTQNWRVSGRFFLVSLLASLINHLGVGTFRYVLNMGTDPATQLLGVEWATPNLTTVGGAVFIIGFLVVSLALMISPRRPNLYEILVFGLFGLLGFRMIRGSCWFGLVMAPVLADHVNLLVARRPTRSRRSASPRWHRGLNHAIAAILAVAVLFSLPWFKSLLPLPEVRRGLLSAETPVAATQYLLGASLPGPLFNDMGFGSYLVWSAQPDYPVFVDPRIENYPLTVWRDYIDVSQASYNWQETLDQYGIRTLFLSRETQGPLIAAAAASAEWRKVYEDSTAVIFARN